MRITEKVFCRVWETKKARKQIAKKKPAKKITPIHFSSNYHYYLTIFWLLCQKYISHIYPHSIQQSHSLFNILRISDIVKIGVIHPRYHQPGFKLYFISTHPILSYNNAISALQTNCPFLKSSNLSKSLILFTFISQHHLL